MSEMHCPNCGDLVVPAIKLAKMLTCRSCSTTLLLEDEGLRNAGEQGAIHDVPMLFGLGDTLRIDQAQYEILGQAQFSYGRGTWDEFWAIDAEGSPVWVSVDEGDLIVQCRLARADWPKYDGYLRLGGALTYRGEEFRVKEIGNGTCIGLKGEFGHALTVSETYRFVNLQGENGNVLSAEIEGSRYEWFLGSWVDPFDVKVTTR